MPINLLLFFVLLSCASSVEAADEKPGDKVDRAAIRQLVEHLASKDLATRENAYRELSNLREAPEELREALKSADPEMRRMAQKAFDFILVRAELKAIKPSVRWTLAKDFQSNDPHDPLVVQDKVIVGTDRGQLRAYRRENGDSAWVHQHGERIYHRPCSDGQRIYFSSSRGLTAVKIDDGTEVWRFDRMSCDGPSLALAKQGTVVAGGNDGILYGVDARTGKQVWTSDFLADAPPAPPNFSGEVARISNTKARPSSLTSDGETLFLSVFDQCRIIAVRVNDGKRMWSFQTRGWVHGSAVATENHVFVGSQDKSSYCLDKRTGKLVWSHQTNARIESGGAVDDKSVYFGSCDGGVYCLDQSDGHVRWRFATDQKGGHASAIYSVPILHQGSVYFAAGEGQAYAVNQHTGALKWKIRPSRGSDLYCSPATDGAFLFVVTRSSFQNTGEPSLVAIGLGSDARIPSR